MLKLGTYGFVRFGLDLFPEASVWAAPVMMTLGVIGIIYGAVCATMQKDLKRLVAYSSIAHLGFIVLGVFSITVQGIEGGILIMVNHGITTGALFLLVGWIYERRHTRQIAELSGLQKVAPIFAGVFTLVMLASVGLPGLNGFPGEFLALLGAFSGARWWGVVAVSGVILAALYLLWAYQRVFHGPVTEGNEHFRELRLERGPDHRPAAVPDRLPRHLPRADARSHRTVGEGARRPRRRGGRRLRPGDHRLRRRRRGARARPR